MKKDSYKIRVTTKSDCMPMCVQVYCPSRKFENLQEILDYAMQRRFNPRNKSCNGLEFVYSMSGMTPAEHFNIFRYGVEPEDLVFKGLPRHMEGKAINLKLYIRIENIVCCGVCNNVFPKYEYPLLNAGFDLSMLSCRECGAQLRHC